MSRIVFLLEERSMKVLLEGLLPQTFGEKHSEKTPRMERAKSAFCCVT
ncbi:hypothetical protein NKDENANG_03318 [Candidatus Entotheonellaceae bacterium PAL068K]